MLWNITPLLLVRGEGYFFAAYYAPDLNLLLLPVCEPELASMVIRAVIINSRMAHTLYCIVLYLFKIS